MKEIKLGLYDWIACLVPGVLVVWAIIELLKLYNIDLSRSEIFSLPATAQVIFLLIITYATGHMLHALANITIDRKTIPGIAPIDYFESQFQKDFSEGIRKEINEQIARYFHLNSNEQDLAIQCYWPCYCLVAETYQDSLAAVFLGVSGFSRGLAMVGFVICLVFLIVGVITKVWEYEISIMGLGLVWIFGIVVVFSALMGLLFQKRVKRFRFYLAKTVYAEFLNICKQKKVESNRSMESINE